MKFVSENEEYENSKRCCHEHEHENSSRRCHERECEPVREKVCSRHPEPGEAILRAGTSGVGPFPIFNTVLSRPIPVTSVTIDTTRMCNPSVLLTFTGQVNLPIGVAVTLNFILTKTTNGGSPQQIGGTYTFSTLATVLEAEAFSFQFFECETCPGCSTYAVEISTTTIIELVPGMTITNGTLSALAVENG